MPAIERAWTARLLVALAAMTLSVAPMRAAQGQAPSPPPAQPSVTQPSVTGAGAVRCSQVVEDSSAADALSGRSRGVYQAWSEGFLTAMNFEQGRQQVAVTDQAAMTPQAQWALLSDHCLLHPDDLFVHAVAALAGSLKRAAQAGASSKEKR